MSRHVLGAAGVMLAAVVFGLPLPALAADTARIEYLNKKAMEDYDSLEFDSARRTLLDCLAKLRAAGQAETPLAAKTYMNLGIVYTAGFHDRARGQKQFERALAIDETIKLDSTLATPELQKVFDAALAARKIVRREAARPPKEARPPDEPRPSERREKEARPQEASPMQKLADNLKHAPVEEAAAGQRVAIYARPMVSIARATLFYRVPGQETYFEAPMGRSRKIPSEIVGYIPADAVGDRSIQYYLQVHDSAGSLVGQQGSPESPFIIIVKGGRPGGAASSEEEDPLADLRRRQAAALAPKPWREHIYFDVALGTGGAIIPTGTTTEVAWYYEKGSYRPANVSTTGFVFSGMAARAELGAFVYRGLSIGVSGRFEFYLNHNADSTANSPGVYMNREGRMIPYYATTSKGSLGGAGLLKVRYQFMRRSLFRPYVHLDIGAGVWRGALNIDGSKPKKDGDVDPSSPLQPTDHCSAEYNGKTGPSDPSDPRYDATNVRMPGDCTSVGQILGFNQQDPETRLDNIKLRPLNRVCPQEGPCVDAVLLGYAMVGGGAGFYLGGKHVGLTVDVSLLAAMGGAQFGMLLDVYVGPQFVF